MENTVLSPIEIFNREREERIAVNNADKHLQESVFSFSREIAKAKYVYNFSWLGRPVFQLPQDLYAMQELIWQIRPDFVIETGIAHGGSLIFYASILEMIGHGRVIGIDIDIRHHNRVEIEKHRLCHRIIMMEGSSISAEVVEQVKTITEEESTNLVILDSNHTKDHVLKELELYTPFVAVGSYCVVCDTAIEHLWRDISLEKRTWGPGNNPKTAVDEFLSGNDKFVIDTDIEAKILLTCAPGGFLKRIG